jgi:hypothetical protein
LNAHKIKYIIFGSFAKYLYGQVSGYNDLDIIYETSAQNISKLIDIIISITGEDREKYYPMYYQDKLRINVKINNNDSIDFVSDIRGYGYEKAMIGSFKATAFNCDVNICSTEVLQDLFNIHQEVIQEMNNQQND